MGRTTKREDKYKVSRTNLHSMEDNIEDRTTFFYHAFRNILLVSVLLLLISALILSLPHSSAVSSDISGTDNLAITISSSCTLGSVVNIPHSKEVYNGNYETNIGKTTITTLCNDGNGYSIYANGYSDNEEGNNKLINSAYPQYSIDTGLATSGLTSAWAMKLNNIENDPSLTPPTIDSSYNDTYGLVPNTWTKVAYRQSGTTDMSEGSSFTTTYSVYASSSQYNGTYNGQVKYVLLHPYRNDATIPITNFEDAFALNEKSKVDVNGTAYYTMQDMNSNICNSIITSNETPTTQLVDIRDNKIYWIAKLADNNCWMTQNLDLDIGGTNVTALTSENTDINTDSTISGVGIYTDGYSLNNGVYTWSPENPITNSGWTNSTTKEYSYDPGDTYPDDLATQQTAGSHGLSGNFYNWTAAVASNNSTSASSDNAANSICPKNWRLPNYDDKELDNLFIIYNVITAIGSNTYSNGGFGKLVDAPLYFIRAGGIGSGGSPAFNVGSVGYSWYSASSTNAAYTYTLRFKENEIKTDHINTKADGLTIRCLAR